MRIHLTMLCMINQNVALTQSFDIDCERCNCNDLEIIWMQFDHIVNDQMYPIDK